ncbi:MAG: ABC transporter transmembrane domain-containing protein [Lachnospira eligens]
MIFLLIYACCTIIYNVEAKRIFGVLSEEVLDEEIHLPFSYYENHHSGEIISKVAYDLNGMGAIYGSRFRRVVMPMLQVIVLLIPMLMYYWQLALCMVFINCVIVFTDMVTLPRIGTG